MISCNSKNEKFNLDLFTVKERTFNELLNHKFKLEIGHSKALIRSINSKDYGLVRIYYVFGENGSKPFSRHIEINIEKKDSTFLEEFFSKYNCSIISKSKSFDKRFYLFVINENNQIFECSFDENEKYNFKIGFKYGINKQDRLSKAEILELDID
jgi:hypothetical protein